MLLNPRDPKAVRTLRRPGWLPTSVAFAPDGKHLYAVGDKSPGLHVWDLQTGQVCPSLNKDVQPYSNLSVAHKAQKMALVVKGGQCRIWDLRTGNEEPGPKEAADKILISPDGKLLAVYHYNSHVIVWDLATLAQLHRFDCRSDGPFHWTFSSDGKLLVTSHDHASFKTWSMANGKKIAEVRGHPSSIMALACSPDGKGLVTTCTSCTVVRWQSSAWQGK